MVSYGLIGFQCIFKGFQVAKACERIRRGLMACFQEIQKIQNSVGGFRAVSECFRDIEDSKDTRSEV